MHYEKQFLSQTLVLMVLYISFSRLLYLKKPLEDFLTLTIVSLKRYLKWLGCENKKFKY